MSGCLHRMDLDGRVSCCERHTWLHSPVVLLCLGLMACLLAGCVQLPGLAADPASYYRGQVKMKATATQGPLTLEIWRVDYESGGHSRSGGTTLISPAVTRVHLRLQNQGNSVVTLFQTKSLQPGVPPPAPPYYLIDGSGRHYPATGSGWSSQAGDPRAVEGKALPGQTVEFTLEFGGIPRNVTSLHLVLNSLQAADGEKYNLQLPAKLPS